MEDLVTEAFLSLNLLHRAEMECHGKRKERKEGGSENGPQNSDLPSENNAIGPATNLAVLHTVEPAMHE